MSIVENETETKKKYRYSAFGLNICSSIKIPELIPTEGDPDVDIEYGNVPDSLEEPTKAGVRFQVKADYFLLKVDNIAKYLVRKGSRVTVEKSPDVNDRDIRLFLLGSVFGALLHQRGMFPLHASAVKVNDKCVAFCGASGSGKSTIARAFIKRGYHMHADDICVISINKEGVPVVYPAYPQLKLWEDALIKTGEEQVSYTRIREVLDKFAVPVKNRFSNKPLPIKDIYILLPYNMNEIKISPLTGMKKFRALKNHTYRFKFVEGTEKEVSHFKTAGIVGNHVSVSHVRRPRKPFLLNELVDLVEKDLGTQTHSLKS